jgi:hypothetical protein
MSPPEVYTRVPTVQLRGGKTGGLATGAGELEDGG